MAATSRTRTRSRVTAKATSWKPPISSQAVKAKTGRGWEEWLPIIDRAQGRTLGHTAIAAMLRARYGISGWWAQMVTLGYEQARGLRALHEKRQGFEIGSSRTIEAGVSKVFAAFVDGRTRARWLRGTPMTIHKTNRNKSLRATWKDGSKSIVVGFTPKGAGKTLVALQHGKLANAAAGKRMKAFWSARLDALKQLAER